MVIGTRTSRSGRTYLVHDEVPDGLVLAPHSDARPGAHPVAYVRDQMAWLPTDIGWVPRETLADSARRIAGRRVDWAITFRCGHEVETRVLGPKVSRPERARRLAEGLCPECRALAYEARPKTDWLRQGFRLKEGAVPIDWRTLRGANRYPVYTPDQVEPANRRRVVTPPAREVDALLALWGLNRHAKRLRDRASYWWEWGRRDLAGKAAEGKRRLYEVKGQVLAHLVAEGRLAHGGYHRFGDDWAEVLVGDGYRYHRPCPPQEAVADDLGRVEAKPKSAKEPRLRDALLSLDNFLQDRDFVAVFEWPPRIRYRDSVDRDDEDDDL